MAYRDNVYNTTSQTKLVRPKLIVSHCTQAGWLHFTTEDSSRVTPRVGYRERSAHSRLAAPVRGRRG